MGNYSRTLTVDENGAGSGGSILPILEFDSNELDSALITADVSIKIGFGDISQAVMPLASQASFSLTHYDFRRGVSYWIYQLLKYVYLKKPYEPQRVNIVRVYAKRQVAGTANIYISYLGGNL